MTINAKQIKTIRQALETADVETIENVLKEVEKQRTYKRIRKTGDLTNKMKEHFEQLRKLTDIEVKKIKYLYSTGNYSMRDLGAKFGVSRQTVLNIVKERMKYVKGGENKMDTTVKICPLCGKSFVGIGAISRTDNTTEICSDCGRNQAMEDFFGKLKDEK